MILAAALFAMAATPALAQTPPGSDPATGARPGRTPGIGDSLPKSDVADRITPAGAPSRIVPTLPQPALGDSASPSDYLHAARAALVAGKTGLAQQSLEMAQTRSLDRSVPVGQTYMPSDSLVVGQIRDALRALGEGDRPRAIALIDRALAG
jgi:hypothetical protein